MIGLDTNVLARHYVEDAAEAEAKRQRIAARHLIDSGQPLMAGKTVVLEFEWVMRGYYGFSPKDVSTVLRNLLGLRHITVDDRDAVERALSNCDAGIEWPGSGSKGLRSPRRSTALLRGPTTAAPRLIRTVCKRLHRSINPSYETARTPSASCRSATGRACLRRRPACSRQPVRPT